MELLNIVLPIFLLVALGWLLRRQGMISPAVDDTLSRLVFNVAAPALLLRSMARTSLGDAVDLGMLAVLVAITVALSLAVYAAARGTTAARRGVLAQGANRSNMVFVGLPIVANAYGDPGLAAAAVVVGVMVVVYNLLAVLLLTLPHRARSAWSPGVWTEAAVLCLRNPLIIGCGVGMLWAATGRDLPLVLDRTLDLVGGVALPLALLSVGAGLDLRRLRAEVGATALTSALKLGVYPAAVWLGLRALGLDGMALAVPVLLMASPTAVTSYVMAREMQGDERLAGAIVIGTTVVSLASYIGWLVLLRSA
jgi:malate permease and related proteins